MLPTVIPSVKVNIKILLEFAGIVMSFSRFIGQSFTLTAVIASSEEPLLITETKNEPSLAFTCTFVIANLSVLGEREGLGILTLYGIGEGIEVTEGVGDGIVLFKVLREGLSMVVAYVSF